MRKLLLALVLLASPALADDIKLEATREEAQALLQLIDQAVRACGLSCAATAIVWADKLQKAAAEPQPEATPDAPH